LEQLRHGDVVTAWAGYRDHDRVMILDDPISLHERAVEDWWQAHQAGHQALLLAGTRAETHALNRLARHHAEDAGLLTGGPLEVSRGAASVALSRAPHGARLYATARHATEIEAGHSHGIPLPSEHDEPEHELLDHLHRSEAKTLAVVTNPDSPAIQTLAQQ